MPRQKLKMTKRQRATYQRQQAQKRMATSRSRVTDKGGEIISGSIDQSEKEALEYLISYLQKTDPNTTKISAIRWAIRFTTAHIKRHRKLRRLTKHLQQHDPATSEDLAISYAIQLALDHLAQK